MIKNQDEASAGGMPINTLNGVPESLIPQYFWHENGDEVLAFNPTPNGETSISGGGKSTAGSAPNPDLSDTYPTVPGNSSSYPVTPGGIGGGGEEPDPTPGGGGGSVTASGGSPGTGRTASSRGGAVGFVLQVGARSKDSVLFTLSYSGNGMGNLSSDLNCTVGGLGMDSISFSDKESALQAVNDLDNAYHKVTMIRKSLNAVRSHAENILTDNVADDILSAGAGIRNTDAESAMMEFTKNQILSNSSQSLSAQADPIPDSVMTVIQ